MAYPVLVDRDIRAGKLALECLDDASVPVDALFWYYFDEWEQWRLVIATSLARSTREGYAAVNRAFRASPHADILLHIAKLVMRPGEKLPRQMRKAASRTIGEEGRMFAGGGSDGAYLNPAYLYRLPEPAAA